MTGDEWVDLRLRLACGHDFTVAARRRSLACGLADETQCPECGRLSFIVRSAS